MKDNFFTGGVLLSLGIISGRMAALKLMGVLTINWWWVFVPVLIPAALLLIFALIVIIAFTKNLKP